MTLVQIPASTVAANTRIVTTMTDASSAAKSALSLFRSGHRTDAQAQVASALQSVRQARAGLEKLTEHTNLLEGTAHRHATHAERELGFVHDRLSLYAGSRLRPDTRAVIADRLFDAEVSARLGSEAGQRSLRALKMRPTERPTGGDTGWGGASEPTTAWVDGQRLDSLGNPVRGYDGYAGPDGSYGGDLFTGEGRGNGGYTGPDGDGGSGEFLG